jgi:hypothetical protein
VDPKPDLLMRTVQLAQKGGTAGVSIRGWPRLGFDGCLMVTASVAAARVQSWDDHMLHCRA